MALRIVRFTLSLPFMAIANFSQFIVWEFLSPGQWKRRRRYSCPLLYYQDQVEYLTGDIERREIEHQQQIDDLQQQHQRELDRERQRNRRI